MVAVLRDDIAEEAGPKPEGSDSRIIGEDALRGMGARAKRSMVRTLVRP